MNHIHESRMNQKQGVEKSGVYGVLWLWTQVHWLQEVAAGTLTLSARLDSQQKYAWPKMPN